MNTSNLILEAAVLLILSLIFLGTWPAILRLCTYIGDEDNNHNNSIVISRIVRRYADNRHPCHVYMDYSVAYVLVSLTIPMISLAKDYLVSQNNNTDQNQQNVLMSPADKNSTLIQQIPLILIAVTGGALLSLGNLTTQWSTAIYSTPLTTILALQASMTVVLGTSLNYFLEPDKTKNPIFLLFGVCTFLVAIGLSVKSQCLYDLERQERQSLGNSTVSGEYAGYDSTTSSDEGDVVDDFERMTSMRTIRYTSSSSTLDKFKPISDIGNNSCSLDEQERKLTMSGGGLEEGDNSLTQQAQVSFPSSLLQGEGIQSQHCNYGIPIGVIIAFFGGICFGFFSPAFNISVNDPFSWTFHNKSNTTNGNDDDVAIITRGKGLSVPVANVFFSLAFGFSSVIWNVYLMHYPPVTNPQSSSLTRPSTILEYVTLYTLSQRTMALLAGTICAMGNVLQFQGGHLAGYAASDLVQAYPLVATIWDVMIFGEFRGASKGVIWYLCFMYISYLSGIILLLYSIV